MTSDDESTREELDRDAGLARYLAAEARIALALQGLRVELGVLGNHLVNLISAA